MTRVRMIRFKSGALYSGETAAEMLEQMRQSDFDPPATLREYVQRAVARASHYFGVTMQINAEVGTEEELCEAFLREALAKGFAREENIA